MPGLLDDDDGHGPGPDLTGPVPSPWLPDRPGMTWDEQAAPPRTVADETREALQGATLALAESVLAGAVWMRDTPPRPEDDLDGLEDGDPEADRRAKLAARRDKRRSGGASDLRALVQALGELAHRAPDVLRLQAMTSPAQDARQTAADLSALDAALHRAHGGAPPTTATDAGDEE